MNGVPNWLTQVFLFPAELFFAALLYIRFRKKKDGFRFRAIIGGAAYLLLAVIIHFFPSFLQFAAIYGIAVGYELLCLQSGPVNAIFDITCAYATQHLAYQLSMLATLLLGISSIWQSALFQLPVFCIIYLAAGKLIAPAVRDMEKLVLDKVQPTVTMVLMLFVATVLSSASYFFAFRGDIWSMRLICCLYAGVCCIFILWVQLDMHRQLTLRRELDFREQLWIQSRQQYQDSKENIDLINQKCHDLKKQITVLKEYCDGSQRQAFFDSIGQSISIYDAAVKTGNEILDTLLTEKSLICKQHGIVLSCMVDGESLSFMDSIDLYTVLSNVLDNAIESVIQLPDEEQRIITLKIFQRAEVAFIQEENCYVGELTMKDGLPVTTKQDQEYHGFGLRSIRCVVEKYSGLLRISAEDQQFTLRISIPSHVTQSKT